MSQMPPSAGTTPPEEGGGLGRALLRTLVFLLKALLFGVEYLARGFVLLGEAVAAGARRLRGAPTSGPGQGPPR